MDTNLKQKVIVTGLFCASVLLAAVAYQFGGAARGYLDASPESVDADRSVAKNYEEVFDNLKKGRRVEIRHKVGNKTEVKVIEGSLTIKDSERRYLHRVMERRAMARRRDYEKFVTKLVTMDDVSTKDMEREAMMSHGALRAEWELQLFERGDFLVIDDAVVKPPIPEGWNWTRYNRMYRVNNQWRAMVTMYDPKKTPRLENEYRRFTSLADHRLDDWARDFNQKTVTERQEFIQRQEKIKARILALSGKNKNQPSFKNEWVKLWREKSPQGIRFDQASWYAMLQE